MVIKNIKRYAVIENGVVINIALADEEHANSQGWIDVEGQNVGPGYLYDGSTFSKDLELEQRQEEQILEMLESRIREQRDTLLAETDFWLLPDLTITQEQLDYRQALRDVPQQEGFPENVEWPEKP